MKKINYKKEELRIMISLGLIAFLISLVFGILQISTNNSFALEWLRFIVLGTFIIPIITFFIFIIGTAAILKSDDPSIIDENIFVREKNRMFFYSNSIKMIIVGIQAGTAWFFSSTIINYLGLGKESLVIIIFFISFLFIFSLLDRLFHEIF